MIVCLGFYTRLSHALLIFHPLFTLEGSPTEFDDNSGVAEKERMWVTRGRNSAVVVTAAWITWVLFVQLIFTDSIPSSWFVRDANSYEATGW